MPLPGPRTQSGPLPGYRNPNHETPTRLNHWNSPEPQYVPGETPGTTIIDRRASVLGFGVVRTLWRQAINYIAAQGPYSWTSNGITKTSPRGFQITRALRYMATSAYVSAGTDNTRIYGIHTNINPKANQKTVTLGAGNVRNRPTIRNRMTSFGSRVPPINSVYPGAEQS